MMPLSRVVTLFLTAVLLSLFLAVGCSRTAPPTSPTSVPPPTHTPVPTPTPINVEDILRRSGDATSQLAAFHFRLQHSDGGSTPFSDTLDITEAEGDVVSPDSVSIDFAGRFSDRFAMRASLITIGDDSYMTNPLSGDWERVPPEVSPLGFFDPQKGVGSMIAGIRNPTLSSKNGNEFIIEGDLESQALRPLLGPATQDGIVRVRISLDEDTLYMKRAVIDGRLTAGEADGVTRTITLSQFNEPLSVTAPDTG